MQHNNINISAQLCSLTVPTAAFHISHVPHFVLTFYDQ